VRDEGGSEAKVAFSQYYSCRQLHCILSSNPLGRRYHVRRRLLD